MIVASAVPGGTLYFAATFTRQFLPGYFHSRLAALGHSRGRLCHMSMGAIFIRVWRRSGSASLICATWLQRGFGRKCKMV